MRKYIIILLLFVCSMSFGQMFSAQNADSGINDTNTYVVIGTQTWMKYNLAVTNYNDGTGIPKVTNNEAWELRRTPAYCWYNNDSATYHSPYGALYNAYAVQTNKLCPTGTHVPDTTEIRTLYTYLGGKGVAGGHLKATGTTYWTTPNTSADNSSGFTALPGGQRTNSDEFIGTSGWWWTTTTYDIDHKYRFYLTYNSASIGVVSTYLRAGQSVRCIKD